MVATFFSFSFSLSFTFFSQCVLLFIRFHHRLKWAKRVSFECRKWAEKKRVCRKLKAIQTQWPMTKENQHHQQQQSNKKNTCEHMFLISSVRFIVLSLSAELTTNERKTKKTNLILPPLVYQIIRMRIYVFASWIIFFSVSFVSLDLSFHARIFIIHFWIQHSLAKWQKVDRLRPWSTTTQLSLLALLAISKIIQMTWASNRFTFLCAFSFLYFDCHVQLISAREIATVGVP